MRVLAIVCLASGVAAAKPEHLPSKFADAASDAFAKGQAAEAGGDLHEAIKQFERANAIAPHPNTYFNLGELYRETKSYDAAIASYRKYLELSPHAPNQELVEKVLKQVLAIPATLEIKTDEPNAVMFVNGKPSGKPRNIDMPAGDYQIDIVTPITFGGHVCEGRRGQSGSCTPPMQARVDGNVVVSTQWPIMGAEFNVDHQPFEIGGRFTAKPGRYDLASHAHSCEPLILDVPSGDVVTYAYISRIEGGSENPKCQHLTIEQRRVNFPR